MPRLAGADRVEILVLVGNSTLLVRRDRVVGREARRAAHCTGWRVVGAVAWGLREAVVRPGAAGKTYRL